MSTAKEDSPDIDVRERGAPIDGHPQAMDRRLFMQLLVFETAPGVPPSSMVRALGEALDERGVSAVLYEDVNHPTGFGLLSWTEDPAEFVTRVRPALEDQRAAELRLRPEFTMLGRTYSSGYESDLEYWLLRRPRETAQNELWPWAVWYPLRRSGAFERLELREKGAIMREHAEIGKAYGGADLAHDIRLACHGLDANDNEFVIGLVGKDLHPLSHVVQTMRRTRQTSEFIVQMGPFFVGRVVFRSSGK
ncbi:MAG: chlorite dismutase family protein [Thermoplasmata archaeon]|nr:chlorite dismutase family protein [Thermoplasmata archaeon]